MNKKQSSLAIFTVLAAAFAFSSLATTNYNTAFAFLGFFFGEEPDDTSSTTSSHTQSSTNLQNSKCYSPQGSIIDSCNSDDVTDRENTGHSYLAQQ